VNHEQSQQSVPTTQIGSGRPVTDRWPIDQATLVQLMGVETAAKMADYLPYFFEASTPQVRRLLLAARQRNGRDMALMAHTLRGSSANMAMTSVVKLCQAIEKAAEAGDIETAVAQVKALAAEYALILDAYQMPPLEAS
jgi:HPt (histidine-containing phosphotransfer) domain-containing protein